MLKPLCSLSFKDFCAKSLKSLSGKAFKDFQAYYTTTLIHYPLEPPGAKRSYLDGGQGGGGGVFNHFKHAIKLGEFKNDADGGGHRAKTEALAELAGLLQGRH